MDNDSDSDVGDILSDLLANDDTEEKQEPSPKRKTLKELDFNFLDNATEISNEIKTPTLENKSEVYDDTLDSSDEEDRRYFEEQNYTDYGRNIKSLLKKETVKKTDNDKPPPREGNRKAFDFSATKQTANVNKTSNNLVASNDVYSDPFFGLRIVSPVISSAELKARMSNKVPVTISKVKLHLVSDKVNSDWVIAGVLVSKSPPRTSQKGSTYSIWKISDLSMNINTVCLFMFSNAYKAFWKTNVGTVIGVLNPNVLESKDNNDLATLSVDNPQKIMVLGRSKDMGKCRSVKKNGEPCNSIVNISHCEFCVFHVKQEYKKCSKRAELQAFSNTQKFSIDMLKQKSQQQKPLKSEMPEFRAVVAVKSKQLQEKDAKRLALLSGGAKIEKSASDIKYNSVESAQQMKKDFEEKNRSRGWKAAVLSQSSDNRSVSLSAALLKLNASKQNGVGNDSSSPANPRLGIGCLGGTIDLSQPITKKHVNRARSNAIKWVQQNGQIKANNPNKVRPDKEEKIERGKKRPREAEPNEEKEAKKPNGLSDKFKEMMQTKSSHTDLIEKSYEQEQEKYFDKLEMKERLEEKMLTTYKVACKAVRCLICKYTSFSASDMCKEQKHPLRVIDATKRFFKCGDCGNRTVSLDRIPSHSCIKCSSSSWTRAAMMDEKKTNVHVTPLSIRGDEESHLGSATKDANLNLLVPEKDGK